MNLAVGQEGELYEEEWLEPRNGSRCCSVKYGMGPRVRCVYWYWYEGIKSPVTCTRHVALLVWYNLVSPCITSCSLALVSCVTCVSVTLTLVLSTEFTATFVSSVLDFMLECFDVRVCLAC